MSRSDATTHWDRILFSAKESVFKAWYPHARSWLGFGDAEVALHPGGSFVARVLGGPALADGAVPMPFTGRWLVGSGLILTAVIT